MTVANRNLRMYLTQEVFKNNGYILSLRGLARLELCVGKI